MDQGRLEIYSVKGIFPKRLTTLFFDQGMFSQVWIRSRYLAGINVQSNFLAINDLWTPRQQQRLGGMDLVLVHEGTPIQAYHRRHFTSQEQRQATLEDWLTRSIDTVPGASSGLTVLYQGKDYATLHRAVVQAFQKNYELTAP